MAEGKIKKPGLLKALLVLLFVSISVYFLTRSVFIYYAQYAAFEKTVAVLFFLAEAFVMIHAFGYFFSVFKISKKEITEISAAQLKDFPSVAILIPSRHEPKEVLESTLLSCYNLDYPNKTVRLLDDSSDEKYKKEAEELCAKFNAEIFRRISRHGAKAGIINDCLKTLKEKYLAIFDADQNPMPDFLSKLIPILEGNQKLAFVQTPQFYSNLGSSKISMGSNMQQAVFYEYICEGKSTSQAMMCCGTNVVFRRQALNEVGGLDETTVTEDFATSFKMQLIGWNSLYYNHVHTFGMGPEDLGAYFKQQNRWAVGNISVLRKILAKFIRSPFVMRPAQWFEYGITGSYYLISWAYFLLLLLPIAYLFFNIPSFFMNPIVYTLTFTPYFILSIAIFYTSMAGRYYSARQLFSGQLLAFITLPVYLKASFLGLIGARSSFEVTAKTGIRRIPYFKLWPQLILWVICLAAVTWGLNRLIYEPTVGIAFNVAWTSYHFVLISSIFYFNEEKDIASACKRLKKVVVFDYRILKQPTGQEKIDIETLKDCFTVFLAEKLSAGTLLMCKITEPDKEAIIFDGNVFFSAQRKTRKGFETRVAVTKIFEADRSKLKGALKG